MAEEPAQGTDGLRQRPTPEPAIKEQRQRDIADLKKRIEDFEAEEEKWKKTPRWRIEECEAEVARRIEKEIAAIDATLQALPKMNDETVDRFARDYNDLVQRRAERRAGAFGEVTFEPFFGRGVHYSPSPAVVAFLFGRHRFAAAARRKSQVDSTFVVRQV